MNAPLYDPDDVAFAKDGKLKRRRVYIAGPMAGLPESNRNSFDAAAADLRGRGFVPINPIDLDLEVGFDPSVGSPSDFDLPAAVLRDIEAIVGCDAIVMLPGHESSRGATAERHVAIWLGIPVLSYPSMALLGEESLGADKPSVRPVDGETVTNGSGAKQSHLSAQFV